ncbi:MAG: universal stress protein [Halobacteriota archaeon]
MSEPILVPTDGGECALDATRRAIAIAEKFGSDVEVLYVVDQTYGTISEWDVVVERQEAEGERALDEAAEIARSRGIPVERSLRRGVPSEEILTVAEQSDVEYIVMGTCGRSGFDRLRNPGSTAERVIRGATVPVVVVPPDAPGDVD